MVLTERPRVSAIRHAVDTLGSETALATLLAVAPGEVARWLSGEQTPTDGTYFVVLALLQQAHQQPGVSDVGQLDSRPYVDVPIS
jgi:hypothetical protein